MRNILCVLCCFVALSTSIVQGGIVSLSGDVEMIAPPFSVQGGALESNDLVRVFQETQNVVLSQDIDADITTSGVFDEVLDLTPGVIPAGTLISSYFLHADTANLGNSNYDLQLVFSQPILGLLIEEASLQATHDLVGWPLTVYPSAISSDGLVEGLELGEDSLILNKQTNTISVAIGDLDTFEFVDHVRVITAAVPEPSSLAILAIGGALAVGITQCRRFRSRRARA